jgi:tyrosine-protein kinase Etk/Wzc
MRAHKIVLPRLFYSSAQKGPPQTAIDQLQLIKALSILFTCALISLASAAVFRFFSAPVYQITSLISIDPVRYDQRSALTISNAKTSSDLQQELNTEVDFLTSRSNLLSVVQKYNLSVNYRSTGLLHNRDLYLESPVVFQRSRMGSRASGHFILNIKNRKSFLLKPDKGSAQEYAFNTTYTDDLGSWQISNMPNLQRFLGSKIRIDVLDPELAVDQLQSNLDVRQSGKPASLLKLSIADPVLSRGNDVLNALLISYLQNSRSEKERLAQSQLGFIETQLASLNEDLSRLNEEKKALSGNSNLAVLGSNDVVQYLSKVKQNDKLLNRLNIKIVALTDLKSQFESQRPSTVDTVNSAIAEPLLNAMARTLYETESSYKRLLQTELPTDPQVTESLGQLQRQKKSLVQEIAGRLAPMIEERKKLMAENAIYANGISGLPAPARAEIGLERKMQVIPDLYADLLRTRENAALNHASYLAYSKPLDSRFSVSENKPFNYLVLLISFAASLSFFLLKALFSTRKTLQPNH